MSIPYFASMGYRTSILLLLLLITASCYEPQRACQAFRNGTFEFKSTINGEEKTTRFIREGTVEIDFFEGKSDTSSVRWINDCEYIVKKLHPENVNEKQAIHMKILSTTENSYTFEYGLVGTGKKLKGTAIRKPLADLPGDTK